MKIKTAKLVKNGVLLNDTTYLPDGNSGHVRDSYNEWLAKGNTPEPMDTPDLRAKTIQQIHELESKVTPRRLREAVLTGDNSFIEDIDNQIIELRNQIS